MCVLKKMVKIVVLNNVFEAHLLEPILSDQQIPYELRTYHDDVYGNLYEVTEGWGAIYSLPEYKAHIEEILQDLRNYSPDDLY